MRIIISILAILIFALPLNASADILPVAIAKFCVNKVVHKLDLRMYQTQVISDGCNEVKTVYLYDNYYLVYGVKVLTGE